MKGHAEIHLSITWTIGLNRVKEQKCWKFLTPNIFYIFKVHKGFVMWKSKFHSWETHWTTSEENPLLISSAKSEGRNIWMRSPHNIPNFCSKWYIVSPLVYDVFQNLHCRFNYRKWKEKDAYLLCTPICKFVDTTLCFSPSDDGLEIEMSGWENCDSDITNLHQMFGGIFTHSCEDNNCLHRIPLGSTHWYCLIMITQKKLLTTDYG